MNQLYLVLAFLLISIASIAGDTETRSLEKFDEVEISSGIKATMIESNENKIEIEVEGIDLEKIKSSVNNNRLEVSVNNKGWKLNWMKSRKIKVTIFYTEAISELEANSGATIECDDVIRNENVTIDVTSGSMIELEVDADDLNSDVSSGASLYIEGEAVNANIEISSGSSFKGADLTVSDASIDASSGSSVKITVTDELTAEASSGASIRYKGSPETVGIDKSSGGSVKKI